MVGADPHRAGPGRGRLHPGAGVVPPRAPRALRRARHPAHRRRGPVAATAGPADVGVRARRDRAGRRRAWPRRSPTACRCRRSSRVASSRSAGDAARTARRIGGNPVACAAGLAVLETIRDEGLVANAEARGAELRAGLGKIAAEDDRIGDIRGLGSDGRRRVRRATVRPREPDGDLPDRLIAACADAGLLVLTCGRVHEVGPLDPAARRQRGRDRRGGRDLRGDARVDPAGLSPATRPRAATRPTSASGPAWPLVRDAIRVRAGLPAA